MNQHVTTSGRCLKAVKQEYVRAVVKLRNTYRNMDTQGSMSIEMPFIVHQLCKDYHVVESLYKEMEKNADG